MASLISLTSIRLDGGTQPRTAISEETVATYAEHMRASAPEFPPVVVFFDGVDHWLADGFHRYHAAKQIGRESIASDVRTGTRREAVLFSACANQTHGLQRTNADKRKAVMTLLEDAEWRQWSNREIGRRVGVGDDLVGEVRRSLPENDSEKSSRTYTTKHGTEATMNTAKIGRSEPKLMMPDRSQAAVAKRRVDIRSMADRGFSTRQIAGALEITEETVTTIAKREGVVIHADRVIGKTRRHDANRIVGQMVMDAENLTADVNLIEFSQLDPSQLSAWIHSLNASRRSLTAFIRQLEEEHKKHGEAA